MDAKNIITADSANINTVQNSLITNIPVCSLKLVWDSILHATKSKK